MIGICPNCEKESSLVLVQRQEELNIRGEIVTVDVEYYKCEECGEEFKDPKSDYDPVEVAYIQYRELKGMVKPEEIRSFRKKYGLTQYEFSKLIGIGIATLNRYENGALQSEAHDRIIRLFMDHRNFNELIEEDTEILDDDKKQIILNIHNSEAKIYSNYLEFVNRSPECYKPTIFNGYKKFDYDKFCNSLKFFCYKNKVFKTKLMKLFFYADFEHYRQYATSITGSCYAHLPHGPVPDNFETLLGLVVNQDKSIRIEEIWTHDYPGDVYTSDSPADLSLFSNSEIKILAVINEKFAKYNAREVRELSHKEKAFRETKDGELIPFSYAEDLQDI